LMRKRAERKGEGQARERKKEGKPAYFVINSDGLGRIKERASRSGHAHLHRDIGHIRKNHLHATLLPQQSKYAHASGVY
jgi:hypothetical protein